MFRLGTSLLVVLGVLSLGNARPALSAEETRPLTVVVLDPLAAPLSCPCVKGYAQRDYTRLETFLGRELQRTVKVYFAESLTVALEKKTAGQADLVIGPASVVRGSSDPSPRPGDSRRPDGQGRPYESEGTLPGGPGRPGSAHRRPEGLPAVPGTSLLRGETCRGTGRPREPRHLPGDQAGDLPKVQRDCDQDAGAAPAGTKGRGGRFQFLPAAPRRMRDCQEGRSSGHRRDGTGSLRDGLRQRPPPGPGTKNAHPVLLRVGKVPGLCSALESKLGFVLPEEDRKPGKENRKD